jgi:hypothetical protein
MPENTVKIVPINDELDTRVETILQDGVEFYWLYFHNVSANTEYLSFDGGTTWKQIATDKTIEITAPPNKIIHLSEPLKGKASSNASKFEMLLLQNR